MDKLVSGIIRELDYHMWKEMYIYDITNPDTDYIKSSIKSMIEHWYNTTVEKEYG